MYRLLLVNGKGEATTSNLRIRTLREFPGLNGLSVHFRPVRNDLLFESAKIGGALAYRILSGEGIVRSQLWVEYEVLGEHLNVIGRSSDLLFALALITSKWNIAAGTQPTIAATGVLDPSGAVLGVERAAEKVAAAVRDLGATANAVVFYPAADAAAIEAWRATTSIPPHLDLRPVAHLDEALAGLGYVLEKVYLRNPFRGLEHFDYEHHAVFFGRDREVRELVSQLLRREESGAPGVLVEGPSGSGKSSFLRAGVLPALVDPRHQLEEIQPAIARQPVSHDVRYAIWRPGLMPTGADEPTIARSILDCWTTLTEWSRHQAYPAQSLTQLGPARREHWPSTMRFVWVIDQFEEIFNLGLDDAVLEHFGGLLSQLQLQGVWTLASIRSDAMPEFKSHAALRGVFGADEGQYYLATLQGLALDDVISLPARAADLSFGIGPNGKRLDQLLREEAYREQDNLPLLQFTLNELYLKRSGSELTYAAYQKLGGLSGSIATTAEAILKAETSDSRRAVRRLFRSLVSVDEAGRATRRYAPIAELDQDPTQKKLLTPLVEARLCVTDQRDGESVVAFAHDSLLRTLPVLVEWLKEEAALLQTRDLAQREARQWQQHGQSVAWLAASDKLVTFKALDAAEIALPAEVRSFIDRSQRHARRTMRVKQAAVCLITVLAIAASIGAWIASKKQREAEYQTAQTLEAQARLLTETAAQRLNDGDIGGAQGIILEVLTNPQFTENHSPSAVNVFQEVRAADARLVLLSGHNDWLWTAAYSPDGTRIVTASEDKTARVWDARTGSLLFTLSGHGRGVRSASFSPDGTRIVTASSDKTARVWDSRTGSQLTVLSGHSGSVYMAAYSPNGASIVTASLDKTARIWDSRTGKQVAVLSGHGDRVMSAAYSPDGLRVVTASFDKTARIWDARTGMQITLLSGHDNWVESAAYSPDGTRIVTASEDKTARIWDARTGTQLAVLSGHSDAVQSAVYSPDGKHIVTASSDKLAHIWDARTGVQVSVLSGSSDQLDSAAYSPDGTRIVTASSDKLARVWDARAGGPVAVLTGHGDHVESAEYSPDGAHIVTASQDQTARVWDAFTHTMVSSLSGHTGTVVTAAYSLDGTRIVTASVDKTARVWDAVTGATLAVLSGHDDWVMSAAFSPDGSRVVTASQDKTARIWNAFTGSSLAVLSGHSGHVQSAAFSPNGTRIVTASDDQTARVWDAVTGATLAVLSGHSDHLESARYSPDGTRIVTASMDRTARIWSANTGAQLAVLSGHAGGVEFAAYSPDGLRVVTASDDQTVRIWDATTGVQLETLSERGVGSIPHASYSPDGTKIVAASMDNTARIWDARIAADLDGQIAWAGAAEPNRLSNVERTQLGLSPDPSIRRWSTNASRCNEAAAAFYDPDRKAPGISQAAVAPDIAISACSHKLTEYGDDPQLTFQMGRAQVAKRDLEGARRQFEIAVSAGYRAAQVDLANLLADNSAGMLDPKRAVSLYERAWQDGVEIAAFYLGHLYEYGLRSSGNPTRVMLIRDTVKAYFWYQKGAGAGEPNALGKLGERDEISSFAEQDPTKRNGLLLEAFRYYVAAAKRAHDEDWPDDAWEHWRYRRVSLARVLAREGMMQDVAAAYEAVRKTAGSRAKIVAEY